MKDRLLIINADGYGFTEGITRAIEDCVAFGTVRSISVNVNFPAATGLKCLVERFPELSIGCHLNPVVGRPVLPPSSIPSLLNERGEFFYKEFDRRFRSGEIVPEELKEELSAQIALCRELAGESFSHLDFHMGKHRLPGLYPLFLDLAIVANVGRIRTHRDLMGVDHRRRRLESIRHYLVHPQAIIVEARDLWLRQQAMKKGLSMPDWNLAVSQPRRPGAVSLEAWTTLLNNVPTGISEFVVHPGYPDEQLAIWSTYVHERETERQVLLSLQFRDAIVKSGVKLAGYRDISLQN